MGLLSGSPVLTAKCLEQETSAVDAGEVMTVEGTIARAMALLMVMAGAAYWPWHKFFTAIKEVTENGAQGGVAAIPGLMAFLIGGLVGGLALSLIISFAPRTAPYLAIPYAFCEGICLGALSAQFEVSFPGIVIQAIAGTFGVLLVMLSCYAFGIIRASQKMRAVLLSAGIGIGLFYLVAMALSWFNVQPEFMKQVLYGSGWLGIGFSVIVCLVAAFYLILDFDMVERGAAMGAPKYMSWYAAFGLLVTLVWLYLEILRLLAKLRSRD